MAKHRNTALKAHDVEAPLQQALLLYQQGQTAEAETRCRAILERAPRDFRSLHLLSIITANQQRFDEALRLIDAALTVNANEAVALNHRGSMLIGLGRAEEALESFDRAVAARPNYAEAIGNRAQALFKLGRLEEALATFDKSLALEPYQALALNNRGNVLSSLNRFDEALHCYDAALALSPGFAEGHVNRAEVLRKLGRLEEVIAACDQALALRPDQPDAWNCRSITLAKMNRYEDALASFRRTLALRPSDTDVHNNLSVVFQHLNRFDNAAEILQALRALNPRYDNVLGNLFSSRMRCCDWRDFDDLAREIDAAIDSGQSVITPWMHLIHSGDAARQLACAKLYVRKYGYEKAEILWRGEKYAHDKIRIAYLSADFHTHATAYLMAALFEAHDRQRFATYAVSFGRDDETPMRARLEAAFDEFIDVRGMKDRDVAALLRTMEIDIAIDLKGYTNEARTDILAHRAAPLQVSYLGYPGTMGTSLIDYIIADRELIPPEHEIFYSEKVIRLPDSYQVNDRTRRISDKPMTKASFGLPPSGFVFCSFNNNYKFAPAVFDVWMRLLHAVEGSVLWLIESSDAAARNLRREAEVRGIGPQRLVFSQPLVLEEHLARHRLADLFLDTVPCNAHTTASDALWAGLPIVTCRSGAFAGRVAASLLAAVGLPELITDSLEDYEALALNLATTPSDLAAIRAKLAQNRDICSLFDTERFCRRLEKAYVQVWERQQRGDPPGTFDVAP